LDVRGRGKEIIDRLHEEAERVILSPDRHVSNNPRRQLDIFDSLSPADLRKIVDNLHDDN
jgi:uncharacterized heparinase superfamily protein